MRRIGLFGGSFDPVHVGHLHVASRAQAARGLERIVFVPAAQPPHKPGQVLASGADRLAMLELALRGHPDWIADAMELERPPPSYTIDSVRAARERFGLDPRAELYLLLGTDNLRGFARWKSAELLLELAEPVVVAREDDLRPLLEDLRRELAPELVARLERAILPGETVDVASSAIRAELAAGRIPEESLPPGVGEYIAARGIYAAGRR